ncbi:ABC-type multidrug transport system ATPase component [Phycicoccus elongatus Lp2]|uniref:ABC-type multidrug transport system ATPase component n=1 Tax=Phycicoccus elongatus Lp2 TaxID=1193181 RepID=N0E124_9MICO|nr:ATP-binding cassette domain-containing protein [Phycicoccus elongatus]CCH69425.1 ABC-type multidrug transport system ATPase component [Phycicoccus elongatus Lp2]
MIQIEHLTKRYGQFTAVDDITFTVQPGTVVGFLGPNGAGKSTALRMVTGLTPPTSGRATVMGHAYRDLPNPGRHVGVMLDASAQHSGRTGREVLTIAALHMGLDKGQVVTALERVGLTDDEAGRRVGNYSLGMRQRLGLAAALLGDPQVLILDEPANGLDPQGIHWMRGLLRDFADGGGTVLLSSHLLTEVQVIADEIVMIGRGRIVAQGTTTDLVGARGTRVGAVDAAALDALATALRARDLDVTSSAGVLLVNAAPEVIGRVALEERVVLTELSAGGAGSLEEMFLELTAATSREGAAA